MAVKMGCAYGQVTRQIVEDLKCNIDNNFKNINFSLSDIKEENKQLYNHLSSRLPIWVTVLFSIFTGLIVGLIINAIK